MKKILFSVFIAAHSASSFSQTIYINECDQYCNKCKFETPIKMEYKVDAKKNLIFRIIGGEHVEALSSCKIMDANNWICYSSKYSSRESAVDGVANYISENQSKDEKVCIFDKSFLGKFSLRRSNN